MSTDIMSQEPTAGSAEMLEARKAVDALLFRADVAAQVTDAASESAAVEFLGAVKKQFNAVEAKRKFIVKPLQDHVKTINDEFKRITEPLEEAESTVKRGISGWRTSEEFREREEKRKRIEVEGQAAVMRGDVERIRELAPEHAAAAAEAPRTVAAAGAKAAFRTVTKFEVTDDWEVPADLKSPDLRKIKAAVDAGRRDIPGIKIWVEQQVAVSV